MDKEVRKQELMARAALAADEAISAVEQAPEGQWIAGSEWQIREIYQRLMGESFREILQARINAHPTAELAAFSPSRQPADSAGQGKLHPPGGQRGRES
jgi:hypothetical protein